MRIPPAVIVLLAGCALAVPAALAARVPLTERANGTTVRVHVGDTVVVTLTANASTGYAWRLTSSGGRVIRVVSTHYVPAPTDPAHPIVGAPGKFVARLAVRAAGRAPVALAYLRKTSPPSPPTKRFRVTIVAGRR